MKTFKEIIKKGDAQYTVELYIDDRIKSRIIATATNGESIAISIQRGLVLQDGTLLKNDDDEILQIQSALEDVSTITAKDNLALTLLAYHLGNRHVPLEISEKGYLRYQVDHVLDDMVVKLGGCLVHEKAKFAPESGAYSHHDHHDHEHHHE